MHTSLWKGPPRLHYYWIYQDLPYKDDRYFATIFFFLAAFIVFHNFFSTSLFTDSARRSLVCNFFPLYLLAE